MDAVTGRIRKEGEVGEYFTEFFDFCCSLYNLRVDSVFSVFKNGGWNIVRKKEQVS